MIRIEDLPQEMTPQALTALEGGSGVEVDPYGTSALLIEFG